MSNQEPHLSGKRSQFQAIESNQTEKELIKNIKSSIQEYKQIYDNLMKVNTNLKQRTQELSQRKINIQSQHQKQAKKTNYLSLLVHQLLLSLENLNLEQKVLFLDEKTDKTGQTLKVLAKQNSILRKQLIILSEKQRQNNEFFSFLKQLKLNLNQLTRFIKQSDFQDRQSTKRLQLEQKVYGQFQNNNMICHRKWTQIQKTKQNNELFLKQLKIQKQRQKEMLKQVYEENYLNRQQKIKTKMINFRQIGDEKILLNYLIEEVAQTQQQRVNLEEQNRLLQHHFETLSEEYQTVLNQNKELSLFFWSGNGEVSQPDEKNQKLALRMKTRIQQLKDYLKQTQLLVNDGSTLSKYERNQEFLKQKLNQLRQANHLLECKVRKAGSNSLGPEEQKQICDFFEGVIKKSDLKLFLKKQRINTLKDQLRDTLVKEKLLQSQVDHLEEVISSNQSFVHGF